MRLIGDVRLRLDGLMHGTQPLFLAVRGAADFAAVLQEADPPRDRTAYVVLNSHRPDAAVEGTGPSNQRVETDVIVVSAIRGPISAAADFDGDELELVSEAVQQCLFDWSPNEDEHRRFTYGGGRLIGVRNGFLFWADTFRSDYWRQ